MDFDLSKEQRDIKKAARRFAEGEFPNIAQECDRQEKYPRDLVTKAAELGFIGINIPNEYGGGGCGYLEKCIITEEVPVTVVNDTKGNDLYVEGIKRYAEE
ncbi:MAG: acyl-CoA dehydrogenase family protein [Deltaproteobacteria bacterium]|nr:MAG: acyl-CoA dehydrogenase family protein [Deltaproteobacteria bacterium]